MPHQDLPRRVGLALFAGHLLTVFSLGISNGLLGLAVLAAPWALRGRLGRAAGYRPILIALGAYTIWLLGAIVASSEPLRSLRAVSELFSLSTLVLGLFLIEDEQEARRLVDGVCLVAAAIALAGLTQFFLGYGDIDRRIRGPLSHYMTFSGVLLVADLLLAARLTHPGGWKSPWRWAAFVVINAAVLGSLTRSAWVALAVGLLALISLRAPRFLLLVPGAALIFYLLAPVPLLSRFGSIFDLTDESNYDRVCMAQAGVEMVRERPLFGIGPDLVKERYPLYREPTAPRFTVPHLHNSFLQLAAERGLPALAAYLALMAASLTVALRQARREGGWRGPRGDLWLGIVLALAAANVAGLFENNWGDTEVQRLVLFVLALPFVLAGSHRPTGERLYESD
ncbi:MAG TPA: O-antigen ligase family protein [Thermoanaerobaculia bacterium]|nr:O-antigen ligase family protein [Thermoanaerobaculia bacterium]